MSDRDILRALNARLATLSYSPAPSFSWGNEEFTPVNGTSWIRSTYLPVDNRPISTNPIQHHTKRIYQVDCFVDETDGYDEAYALADAVSALFFPATNETLALTAGSYRIHINRRPDKTPLTAQAGFVGVAVLVRCFALT